MGKSVSIPEIYCNRENVREKERRKNGLKCDSNEGKKRRGEMDNKWYNDYGLQCE